MTDDGPDLNTLLKTPIGQLEDGCINSALMVAVETGSQSNAAKLIIRGATNIDRAIEKSHQLKNHSMTAALLLNKAAMKNDLTLVRKLFGDNVDGIDTILLLLNVDNNFSEIQRCVRNQTVKTMLPIEVARQFNAHKTREELLFRTGVDRENCSVMWVGLGLVNLENSWLHRICWVKDLNLSGNQFTSLPPEMGSYLKQCTKFDLQQNKLSEIPHCLFELPSIRELNLSHNEIVEIPDVPEWSETLLKLDLSFNQLRSVPDSAVAINLQSMNISNNQFYTVPQCVCSFVSLTTLNLADNSKIRVLPTELGRLRYLTNLNLDGLDNLNDPPRKVCITATDCVHYLYGQLQSSHGYFHMRLILVGKQAVGKSTIVARLGDHEISNKPTVGVDISEWKYSPARYRITFNFNIWDFSGQEKYYAIHQYLMSQRSLYLLVWNITEGDDGVADLKPWLSNIALLAPDSCVIIVGTFLDKVSEEDRQAGKIDHLLQKVQELTAQYQHLVVAKITMVGLQGQMENVAQLKVDIYNAASEYKINGQYVIGAKLPSSYHKLDAKLTNIHQKVKYREHKPIMHGVEIKRMVRNLGLLDIYADEELCAATKVLHQVGVLLHYDDHKHHLDDLYFVDPQWLCDLLSAVFSVKQSNLDLKQGVFSTDGISLFKNKRFPLHQSLTLLDRFEIVVPLDKEYKRILIPSLLPDICPAIVNEHLLDDKSCFKRFIHFCSSVSRGSHPIATPLGLWSHLLTRVINCIEKVRSMLYHQAPCEEWDETNNNFGESITVSGATSNVNNSNNLGEVSGYDKEVLMTPIQTNDVNTMNKSQSVTLVFWRTGLFYNVNGLCFCIESLSERSAYESKDGILITCSSTIAGRRILSHLVDTVEQLITEWYPGLAGVVEQMVPCCECLRANVSNPYEFRVDQLLPLVANNKLTTECGLSHKVQLVDLVPDQLFIDLDHLFHLDSNKVIYSKEKESLLGAGAFGEIYRGEYRGLPVAIKLHLARNVIERFKAIRSDSTILQQLHHPCLVCMVGVTIHPTMSLVLENPPLGTLQSPLLQEQRAFSRIVLYRIAIQVVSALQFLHNNNIIFGNLKADNVLLWSLSPDHLINCKVTDFSIATQYDPKRSRGFHGIKGFIAPEVSHYDHTIYDHRADIFSFGMFLYQLLARRHPFHNVRPSEIEAAIAQGQRPLLRDVPIAQTGLFYMTQIMRLCFAGNADDRPSTQEITKWLSTPALQLIMSVVPIKSKYSIRNGCFVTPTANKEVGPVPASSEVWICCYGSEGVELDVFDTNTMMKMQTHFVTDIQVHDIKQCGDHIWLASQAGLEYGAVCIFNQSTKELVHHIKTGDNLVSRIAYSDELVYMGTMEGYCLAFPSHVSSDLKRRCKYLSEYPIDGLVVTRGWLWASTGNRILLLNPESLDIDGMVERTSITHALIGQMNMSDDGNQVWSSHVGGMILSSWNARRCVHLCDIDMNIIAKEKCHVDNPKYQVITAMCTALDTVWIGLESGHIFVFSMNPVGEVLTYFRPYQSFVRFLSATNYPGPCQKEKCMMISGGKMYQPDDRFKELTDCSHDDKTSQSSVVVVLWEALPAKYMQQVQYLNDGSSWQNYSRLEKTMTDTGFTDSKECCHAFMHVSTVAIESTPQETSQSHHQIHQANVHQPINEKTKQQPKQEDSSDLLVYDLISGSDNVLSGMIIPDET